MKAKIELPATVEQLENIKPQALDAQRLELQARAEGLDKQYCQALLNIQSVSDELDRLSKQLSSAKGEKVRAMATGKPVDEPEKLIETVQSKITEQSQIRDFSQSETERLPKDIEAVISEMRICEDISLCQRQVMIGKKLQKALKDAAVLMKQYHKTTSKISAENRTRFIYSVKRAGLICDESGNILNGLVRVPITSILNYVPQVFLSGQEHDAPAAVNDQDANKYLWFFNTDSGEESEGSGEK